MPYIHFLDTCLFFAYSYFWETENSRTKQVFESSEKLVTSHNVEREIDTRRNRRKKFYIQLSKHISSGGTLNNFQPIDIHLTQNDNRHITQFKNEIEHQCTTPEEILRFLRTFISLVDKKISYCKSKLEHIVPSGDDITLHDIFCGILNNTNDAKILIDAVVWSESVTYTPYFVTLDWTDIIRNKKMLYDVIKNTRGMDPHPLEIKYLREI